MKLTLQNHSERFPKSFIGFLHAPGLTWKGNRKDRRLLDQFVVVFFCIYRKRLLSKEHLYVKERESTLYAIRPSQVLCSALANCHIVINNLRWNLIPKTMPFQSCLKPHGTLGKRKKSPTCIVVTLRKSLLVLWLTYGQQMLWQK